MKNTYIGVYARIIGVVVVFQWIHIYVPEEKQFLYYVIATFLTDFLDSAVPQRFAPPFETSSFHYQSWDKVLDLLTYLYFIWYTSHMYSTEVLDLLWLTWVWRAYGVYQYILRKDGLHLFILYPDMFNAVMLVVLLSTYVDHVRVHLWTWMWIGMILKLGYEKLHDLFRPIP